MLLSILALKWFAASTDNWSNTPVWEIWTHLHSICCTGHRYFSHRRGCWIEALKQQSKSKLKVTCHWNHRVSSAKAYLAAFHMVFVTYTFVCTNGSNGSVCTVAQKMAPFFVRLKKKQKLLHAIKSFKHSGMQSQIDSDYDESMDTADWSSESHITLQHSTTSLKFLL